MVETIVSEATPADASRASTQADLLSTYLREVGRVRCLTPLAERALRERIGRGDRAARNELISANLRLVVSVCRGYRGLGLPFADLIAEGNLGLVRAAQSFEFTRGRFAEYADWWIRAGIARALEEQTRFRALPGNPRTYTR
jgi:RNA polymerase primary sigma factor